MERVVYGHIVDIEIYKDLLKQSNIECLVKNEFENAMKAGFGSGIPGNAELFVEDADKEKAVNIIEEFKKANI